jgi:hypothetical protein
MNPDPLDSISTRDPDTQPIRAVGTGERQRAAIVLGVIAIVALIIVGIMVAVLGSNSNNTPTTNGQPTGPPVSVITQPNGQSSGHSTKPHPKNHNTQPHSSPNNAPVSCPSSAPCDQPADVGNVVQALNDYRMQHGKPAVSGTVTQAARICAVTSGNTCPSGFYWEPVGRSGREVIQKIAANGGDSWLLDDRMTAVQVGWAYIPSSKSFECALVSNAP